MGRPYRACAPSRVFAQGVALGWYVTPRRGYGARRYVTPRRGYDARRYVTPRRGYDARRYVAPHRSYDAHNLNDHLLCILSSASPRPAFHIPHSTF
jgi:hypothetical protein